VEKKRLEREKKRKEEERRRSVRKQQGTEESDGTISSGSSGDDADQKDLETAEYRAYMETVMFAPAEEQGENKNGMETSAEAGSKASGGPSSSSSSSQSGGAMAGSSPSAEAGSSVAANEVKAHTGASAAGPNTSVSTTNNSASASALLSIEQVEQQLEELQMGFFGMASDFNSRRELQRTKALLLLLLSAGADPLLEVRLSAVEVAEQQSWKEIFKLGTNEESAAKVRERTKGLVHKYVHNWQQRWQFSGSGSQWGVPSYLTLPTIFS
jgi:hypothetical protein